MSKVFVKEKAKSEINVFPLGNAVYVDLYDDGSSVIDLGNGKKFFLLHDNTFGGDTFHKNTSKTHKHPGIRPRWARVIAVNEESEKFMKIGDKILVDALEWSAPCPVPGLTGKKFYRVAVEKVSLIDDEGFSKEEMKKLKDRPNGVGYWVMDKE